MKIRSFLSISSLSLITLGTAVGCLESPDSDPEDGPDASDPQAAPDLAALDLQCRAAQPGVQTFLCAGVGHESDLVSQRALQLYPVGARAACNQYGTSLSQQDPTSPDPGGAGGSDATGGWNAGGAWGGYGGGDGYGGAPPDGDEWCAEFPNHWMVGGITFSVNECGDSELSAPIRFEEPNDWYRLRVYAGETPCERGELIAEQAGMGQGGVVELDLDLPAGFITVEIVDEGYYYDYYDYDYYYDPYYWEPYYYSGETLQLELNDISLKTTTE